MNEPRDKKPDAPPSPERDTSREGREEEVINQQDENKITNADSNAVVNSPSVSTQSGSGESQFKEGIADNTVKLDEVEEENLTGSDRTGDEESGLPGSGI